MKLLTNTILLVYPISIYCQCPFSLSGTPSSGTDESIPDETTYNEALETLDIPAVMSDIEALLTDSQECWPADEFNGVQNYGAFFIRLAWHCSGTYRETDGVGGCAGGRQRFPPEADWEDNANLDHARALLGPIKETYGDALSWGDLFVFAGTAAIMNMGGPIDELCAGRIDDSDGTNSLPLDEICDNDGDCGEPFGTSTIGLIYVNPEGVFGDPDPSTSAIQMREIFSRMGMNDEQTVALIGGGHAFGKAHVHTSGIEGQWTSNPLQWDNEYFVQLNDYANGEVDYELITGEGGKWQWRNTQNGYMMMTSDLALVADDSYKTIVAEFANDLTALDSIFSKAWQKLTENGGTWAANKKCMTADELESINSDLHSIKADKGNKNNKNKKRSLMDILGYVF